MLPVGAGVATGGLVVGIVVGNTINVGEGAIVGSGVTVCNRESVGVGVRVGVVVVKVIIGVADRVADWAICVPPANTTKLAVIVFEIPYWSRV